MERVRSFVAILLSEAVRAAAAEEISRLRPLAPRVGWVAAPNLHLTVKFLGELVAKELEEVKDALGEAVAGTPPFSLVLSGMGAFPGLAHPRVLWIGVVEGGPAAQALQARVEEALGRRGFPKEGRPYSPHLTIARVREPRGLGALQQAMARDAQRAFGVLEVRALSLMRSDLSPAGARYTELAAFPLGAA